jgi:hypothetical protein
VSWTVAPAAACLLDQATDRWPARSRVSDGTIGDPAHSSRTSDHNPDGRGVVHAADLTHDPAAGCDDHANAEAVKDDPRTKYVIWDHRIWNPSISRTWRPYTGSNPHDKHMHVSVLSGEIENSTRDWFDDLDGEDFTIMDKATKDYLDDHFAGVRSAQRRARETQLAQGQLLKKLAQGQKATAQDLAEIDADLDRLADDLRDG